jgi:hypothetical protein
VQELNTAVQMDATNAEYFYYRGKSKFTETDLEGAIEDLQKAVNL